MSFFKFLCFLALYMLVAAAATNPFTPMSSHNDHPLEQDQTLHGDVRFLDPTATPPGPAQNCPSKVEAFSPFFWVVTTSLGTVLACPALKRWVHPICAEFLLSILFYASTLAAILIWGYMFLYFVSLLSPFSFLIPFINHPLSSSLSFLASLYAVTPKTLVLAVLTTLIVLKYLYRLVTPLGKRLFTRWQVSSPLSAFSGITQLQTKNKNEMSYWDSNPGHQIQSLEC